LRRISLGQFIELGVVTESHYGGKIAIVRMNETPLSVGDEVFVLRGQQSWITKVTSIQIDGSDASSVRAEPGSELGVGLSSRCKAGDRIITVVSHPSFSPQQMPFDPDAFSPSFAAEAGDEGSTDLEEIPSGVDDEAESPNVDTGGEVTRG
jgi:hypothetical protein